MTQNQMEKIMVNHVSNKIVVNCERGLKGREKKKRNSHHLPLLTSKPLENENKAIKCTLTRISYIYLLAKFRQGCLTT